MLRVSPQTPVDDMEPHHETGFPTILSNWLREIVLSLPEAARTTIVDLIIGAMLAGGGHVTQAFLALTPRLGWQAYHWMIERGRFRLLGLITALCGIIRREVRGRCFAIIDDTLAPRSSTKAPGAAPRFDHAGKTNRPKFPLCQSFVTLSTVVPCRDRPRAVPVVTGLCRSVGNSGKLAIAKGLLRAVGNHLGPLYLLLDAWYMRGPLIRAALRLGHDVIGQVRRDTALFRLPSPRVPGTRGRRRLYGETIDADAISGLPISTCRIEGYGGRVARLRDVVCRPQFLRGVIVRAVWCDLETRGGRRRLLLSTDPALSAPAIVEAYSNRWSTEPLFYALKLTDGMGAMWQRGRTALLRWLHLVQIGRALLFLLTARAEPEILALVQVGGWRKAATLTPELVKDALANRFRNFQAFRLVPATGRKFGPVRGTGPPGQTVAA
jgi:hypothetical protein